MTDNIAINKGSKLFQRFLQAKKQKSVDGNMREPTEYTNLSSEYQGKENSSMSMNRCPTLPSASKESESHCKKDNLTSSIVREKKENNNFVHGGRDSKIVQNSLNISNGLGLDNILKRAIERVRQSKAEELMKTKILSESEHDDSLQKLSRSKSSVKMAEQAQSQQLFFKEETDEFKCSISRVETKCSYAQTFNQEALDSSKVEELRKKIQGLQDQLVDYRHMYKKLQLENQKLMKEVNRQVSQNQQLEKEIEKLMIEVKQFERLATQKDQQIKKHSDDANHWRNQYELLKINTQTMASSTDILETKIQNLNIENFTIRREMETKESQLNDARMELKKIEKENHMAKQYLYEMTVKLYNSQQELIKFRGIPTQIMPQTAKEVVKEEVDQMAPPSRTRQFSRQRITKRESKQKEHSSTQDILPQEVQEAPRKEADQTDTYREARIAELQQQLSQLAELKCMTGKIRRRKIQLERQLQGFKK